MRHLHRIVDVLSGTNILGLLELFASIGVFSAAITLFDQHAALVAGIGGVGGIMVFDLWWRYRQPEAGRWTRLFSPFTGGCILFIPIWLVFPLFALSTVALILIT